jgi:lysophospholipase L1-like esterase
MKLPAISRVFIAFTLLLLASSCSSGPSGPSIDFTDKVIVAFGNSITKGVGDRRYPSSASGYPFRLEELLKISFPSAIVVNRGVAGEKTSEGVRRLPSVLLRDAPDYVLILEGVNDIPLNSLESIVRNLDTMVRQVKDSGAIPLIASLTPTTGSRDFKNAGIDGLNPMIQSLAAGEGIVFVDLNAAFLATEDFTMLLVDDGLHPNSAGYQLMAETWDEGLQRTF